MKAGTTQTEMLSLKQDDAGERVYLLNGSIDFMTSLSSGNGQSKIYEAYLFVVTTFFLIKI